jgi:hypothetical protein
MLDQQEQADEGALTPEISWTEPTPPSPRAARLRWQQTWRTWAAVTFLWAGFANCSSDHYCLTANRVLIFDGVDRSWWRGVLYRRERI